MEFKIGDIIKLKEATGFYIENDRGDCDWRDFESGTLFKFVGFSDEVDPDYPDEFNEDTIDVSPLVGNPDDIAIECDAYDFIRL